MLILYPADLILIFDKTVTELYKELFLDEREKSSFERSIITQIVNLKQLSKYRELDNKESLARILVQMGFISERDRVR